MKRKTTLVVIACATVVAAVSHATTVDAHSGPPFPIVSNQIAGPYDVSVWTDPDATADGSAAGQFWVVVQPANRATSLPADTKVNVTIQPADGGPALRGTAKPVNGDVSRQFVALLMDHEGRYAARASIEGPLGSVDVAADVDATYDLRPSSTMVAVYVMPFVLVGFLWIKLLLRRRHGRARA
jgi:hypothetical protein